MDPIRRKLVELRDEWADTRNNFPAEPADRFEAGVTGALEDHIAELDAILADWNAADEIRPTQCEAKGDN